MGNKVSKNNALNAMNMVTDLGYVTACKHDSDLRSFDDILQSRTNRVINIIAKGVKDGPPLSLSSLQQVIQCLLDMDQDVVKVILDYKKDIWNDKELLVLVDEYFDISLKTLHFYNALEKRLQSAMDSQLEFRVALQRFDEETENRDVNNRIERMLEGLQDFKAAGNPLTQEVFQIYQSVYEQQKDMLEKLELKKNELGKKLKRNGIWRKVFGVIFVVTVATGLICSVVAAVFASPAAPALVSATMIVYKMGTWIDSLWKNFENALKGQEGVISSTHRVAYVAIKELESIQFLVQRLESKVDSLMRIVDLAIKHDSAKLAIDETKKKLDELRRMLRI